MAVISAPRLRAASLGDRYKLERGTVFLSGVQSLVRVLLDQHRADVRAGRRTATFVSGYQGSPLGGFDLEVARLADLAAEHQIVHRPGLNEELGATAVWGTQTAPGLPGATVDGVVGVWYGKAPGLDRSADAIRHGNFVGASPSGGVVALVADDPQCKSSTLPSASEATLASLHVPVMYPGSVQEALDLGRHAIECSRASGLWCAVKVVTAVADATATADIGPDRIAPTVPTVELDGRPYVHRPSAHLLAPQSLQMERTLHEARLPLAQRYARANGLSQITHDRPAARLGIVTAGTPYHDLMQALSELGVGDHPPARILKLGMLFPLDAETVREFASGLDEILVLEEKGPFLESLVKGALYGMPSAPRIAGKRTADGAAALVPGAGHLDPDTVARALHRWLDGRVELPEARERMELLAAPGIPAPPPPAPSAAAQRTPFYCSGCPHNLSTKAPDDAIVGAGIGCHTMVMLGQPNRGRVTGVTQMGGEGAQWIGVQPFVPGQHFVQNLGDGTFYHSGSLAIRAAVAAGVNVTYKLLFNGAVAMTGGQAVEGQRGVGELTRLLEAEGVTRIVITTDDLSRYGHTRLSPLAEVRPRTELDRVQRELADVPGVTILIHDQACAAEARRARKRGKAPAPPQRVLINERVCEGCGDCGEKSSCASVEPVETEFGRKTRIHQASCNQDFACLEGDCPSFLSVIAPSGSARPEVRFPDIPLPDPEPGEARARIRMVGIGGTGVVTVSQVLGMAALLDGLGAAGLDQTGLSQKGGPVVSDIEIGADVAPARAAAAWSDTLLAFDLLGAATPRNLSTCDPHRTVAFVCTNLVPTATMIVDPDVRPPELESLTSAVERVTRPENVYIDARALSQRLFADHMQANMIVLGAAWQRGRIPVSAAAIEQAIRLNGATVESNLAAFAWGRAWVAAPEIVSRELRDPASPPVRKHPQSERLVELVATESEELRDCLRIRVSDLIDYQGRSYAERYARTVARFAAAERERLGSNNGLTLSFAQNLHKLMAYKDEYEVARLHLDFVRTLEPGTKLWLHLHPPTLRELGLRRKLKLGRWSLPALALLRGSRRLRATPLDPFGRTPMRRVERSLPGEYVSLVETAFARLDENTAGLVRQVCELPQMIRGYEQIKLDSVVRFRAEAARLSAELG